MKKIALAIVVMMLALAGSAHAGNFYAGRVPWSQANVQALHGADLATVAKFVNATPPADALAPITPNQVVGFAWANVGGNSTDLVVALDFGGGGFYTLWIYSHGGADRLVIQQIRGWKRRGGLKAMLRDLNGDGMDELIVLRAVGQGGVWTPPTAAPKWPEIYRPENGRYLEAMRDFPNTSRTVSIEVSTRYVEASRDFPNYYDTEVLPGLNRTISTLQRKVAEGDGNPGWLAGATAEKDKILRVLGRNPIAGLNQAYKWMNSDNPQVLQCAIATFYDIGGHQKELRTARKRLPDVLVRAVKRSKGEL